MRRILIAAVIASALPGLAGMATAQEVDLSGAATVHQDMSVSWWNSDGSGFQYGWLSVETRSDTSLPTLDRSSLYTVWGFIEAYDSEGWGSWVDLPQQPIGPDDYTADPIGNSVTFDATLLDQDGQERSFSFTLTRPQLTFLQHPSTNNPGVNASWGPSGADAGVNTTVGVNRADYTIEGDFDGLEFSYSGGPCGTPCQFGWASTSQRIALTPGVAVSV